MEVLCYSPNCSGDWAEIMWALRIEGQPGQQIANKIHVLIMSWSVVVPLPCVFILEGITDSYPYLGSCWVNCKGNENEDFSSCPSGNLCLGELLLLTAQRNVPAYFPFLSILWASRIDCILFSFCPGKVRLLTSWIFAFPEDSPLTGWQAWSVHAHFWPWSHKALNIPLYSIRCKSSPPTHWRF